MPQEPEINTTIFNQEPVADVTGEAWGNTEPPAGEFPEFDETYERTKYLKFGGAIITSRSIWD